MSNGWLFQPTLKYIPVIIVVGISIGIGAFALGTHPSLVQALTLHTVTSLSIGYSLVFLGLNQRVVYPDRSNHYQTILLALVFMIIGVVGSEAELLVKATFFSPDPYIPFTGGGLYIFNGILSIILGFSILNSVASMEEETESLDDAPEAGTPFRTIPVKKGTAIHLLPLDTLSLFEAAGKYAYVYDTEGQRYLCNYTLGFLGERLPDSFIRIHRRYIVNTLHIAEVQPFDKKRYMIGFTSKAVPPVKSSTGYQEAIRELINI